MVPPSPTAQPSVGETIATLKRSLLVGLDTLDHGPRLCRYRAITTTITTNTRVKPQPAPKSEEGGAVSPPPSALAPRARRSAACNTCQLAARRQPTPKLR